MTKMSKKIIFFGNERLATGVTTKNPVLNALVSNGYEIEHIILNQDAYSSRKNKIQETEVLAQQHNIACHKPTSNLEIKSIIENSQSDIAVLVAYGKLIPQDIIDLFKLGIINLHPSLLPKKRGPTPIEQTILDGDTYTGVSIMRLTKGMDDGPLYDQKMISISGHESKQELCSLLGDLGANIIIDVLPAIIGGKIDPRVQNEADKSITKLIDKSHGKINWHESGIQIERKLRAYSLWPRSFADIAGKRAIITDVRLADHSTLSPGTMISDTKKLIISSMDRNVEILRLIPENKQEMSGEDFMLGYKK